MLGDQHGVAFSIVGRALHHEHSGVLRNVQQLGICRIDQGGTNGLGGATDIDGQQLVEAGSLDISQGEGCAQLVRTPDRDSGERGTIGEVQSAGLQHSLAQQRSDVGRGFDELEVEHLALRGSARRRQLTLDRGQHGQTLRQAIGGSKPADSLPRFDHTFGPQHLECLANRHSARLIGRAEICFAGKQSSGGKLASDDAAAQIICDLGIAKRPHLY